MQEFDITTDWQQISDGSKANIIVQANNECMLYIGGAAAPTENPPIGIRLGEALSGRAFLSSGMTGTKVYMKSSGPFKGKVVVGTW